jgi:hypothetical protein
MAATRAVMRALQLTYSFKKGCVQLMVKFLLLIGLVAITLTGCESKSKDVEMNQLKKDLNQTKQTLTSVQAEINTERDINNQLENKLNGITNGDNSDQDLLAVSIKIQAKEMATNQAITGNMPILYAYILASHLTPKMVYIKNDAVLADNPIVADFLGNTLDKDIKSRFIRVLFNTDVYIPIYARGFENDKVTTKELLFVVDEKTNLPSLFVLREDGKFDHYTLDERGMMNYDPRIWVDELSKYTDKRDQGVQSSGTE